MVKDGRFYGFAFLANAYSDYGSSISEVGTVFIDGTEAGTTSTYYSHDSENYYETIRYSYCIKKKEKE